MARPKKVVAENLTSGEGGSVNMVKYVPPSKEEIVADTIRREAIQILKAVLKAGRGMNDGMAEVAVRGASEVYRRSLEAAKEFADE